MSNNVLNLEKYLYKVIYIKLPCAYIRCYLAEINPETNMCAVILYNRWTKNFISHFNNNVKYIQTYYQKDQIGKSELYAILNITAECAYRLDEILCEINQDAIISVDNRNFLKRKPIPYNRLVSLLLYPATANQITAWKFCPVDEYEQYRERL